jgi:putative FmdB family regulatory protein
LPLYEYSCVKCKRHTEKIENLNGPHLRKCPHCGGKMESVITAPAIQFKGSGWYVNDYGRGKTSGGDASKSDKSEKSEKSDKSEKSEKSDKRESKPAPSGKDQKKSSSSSKEK